MKQNSTIVIVPSSPVETMGLGGLAGLTALTMGLGQDRVVKGNGIEVESKNGDKQLTAV